MVELTEEEQRARAHQQTLKARERNRKATERARAGDAAARTSLGRNWKPLTDDPHETDIP